MGAGGLVALEVRWAGMGCGWTCGVQGAQALPRAAFQDRSVSALRSPSQKFWKQGSAKGANTVRLSTCYVVALRSPCTLTPQVTLALAVGGQLHLAERDAFISW